MVTKFNTIKPYLMMHKLSTLLFSAAIILFSSCKKNNEGDTNLVLITANGDITAEMAEFRHLLGDQLNTTPGATTGRREINWEGVPDSILGLTLPEDFFNQTGPAATVSNQRGFTYASVGSIQVSKTNFSELNPQASTEFASFSGNKAFANVTANDWEVGFEVPGQSIPATVRGFAAVFSDVDIANSTSLEFFNGNKNLGQYFVPVKNTGSNFSFLGVYFRNNERITRIRIRHDGVIADGEKDISAGGPKDLIIMDDLLYSEPEQ
jgi:hypothetical protein